MAYSLVSFKNRLRGEQSHSAHLHYRVPSTVTKKPGHHRGGFCLDCIAWQTDRHTENNVQKCYLQCYMCAQDSFWHSFKAMGEVQSATGTVLVYTPVINTCSSLVGTITRRSPPMDCPTMLIHGIGKQTSRRNDSKIIPSQLFWDSYQYF